MRVYLLALLVVSVSLHVEAQHLPDVLIHRARVLIEKAEHDLLILHEQGHKVLTRHVEAEIAKVRLFEQELMHLEKDKHLDPVVEMQMEQKLLAHENTLIIEILKVEQAIQEQMKGKLPEQLIKAAQFLLKWAEGELKRHKDQGHLVDAIEHEIKGVHELEVELHKLIKDQHVPPKRVFEYEMRLLGHENKLAAEVLVLDHKHHSLPVRLPEILIKRAQAIIERAEIDLDRHRKAGKLVHAMEEEIHKVRKLEMELLVLDKSKHIDTEFGFKVEMALLGHENFLIAESIVLEHQTLVNGKVVHKRAAAGENLPEVLIKRAQAIIHKAETDLKMFHDRHLRHLTQLMEEQIHKVKQLEVELHKLEKDKDVPMVKFLELEDRLLHHENVLLEESIKIEKEARAIQDGKLAQELIDRAEATIRSTEALIAKHKLEGHLVDKIESELKRLHVMAEELRKLEKDKRVPADKVFEYELRLLDFENKIWVEDMIMDHQHHLLPKRMPEYLIHMAQRIIRKAEFDLEHHRKTGHVAKKMEDEIHKVRKIEMELMLLEKRKHIDEEKEFELELALFIHESILLKESLEMEHGRNHHQQKRAAAGENLPEVLIKRAQAIIHKAEADLKMFHDRHLRHLTQAMEEEIHKVKQLEVELHKLEKGKDVPLEKFLELENRLLHHENVLLEESIKIEKEARAIQDGKLAQELIDRAEKMIKGTEEFIAKHKLEGHLVDKIESELKRLHVMAEELRKLEKDKHVPADKVFEFELRLLDHENRIIIEELILDHHHHLLPKRLPEFLIHFAQRIIRKAEFDLEHHRKTGHVAKKMEDEIHKVRKIEMELILLEKGKHIDEEKEFEYEMALFIHESILLKESLEMEHGRNYRLHKRAL